jgi:predicted rRNA methylase YqxC with S4 and FtsJ domains
MQIAKDVREVKWAEVMESGNSIKLTDLRIKILNLFLFEISFLVWYQVLHLLLNLSSQYQNFYDKLSKRQYPKQEEHKRNTCLI